jgi:hypothetical protein
MHTEQVKVSKAFAGIIESSSQLLSLSSILLHACVASVDFSECSLHIFSVAMVTHNKIANSFLPFFLLKSWTTQNFITIKTSWNTNDQFVSNLIYYNN